MQESSAYVTSTSEALQELSAAFGILEKDVNSAEERLRSVTQVSEEGQRTRTEQSFFDLANPGVWFLWAILLGAAALLIAFRRESGRLGGTNPLKTGTLPVSQHIPVREALRESSGTVLVNPVKFVKIKVRKIKK